MEWSMVWLVVTTVATLALGVFSIYLTHDRDMEETKKHVAQLIGDALAQAVALAKGNMAAVTDKMLDDVSGGVYDYIVPKLPDGLPGLVMRYWPKDRFQAQFRKVWREYSARNAELKASVARQ